MWGYPRPVLGAVDPFLKPFRGRFSPNIDNVSEKLTLGYPHEGPWVVAGSHGDGGGQRDLAPRLLCKPPLKSLHRELETQNHKP